MASIRYRAPWRVMVNGEKQPRGVFVSKTQAEALSAALIEQGINKDSINLVQEREGSPRCLSFVGTRRLGNTPRHFSNAARVRPNF